MLETRIEEGSKNINNDGSARGSDKRGPVHKASIDTPGGKAGPCSASWPPVRPELTISRHGGSSPWSLAFRHALLVTLSGKGLAPTLAGAALERRV